MPTVATVRQDETADPHFCNSSHDDTSDSLCVAQGTRFIRKYGWRVCASEPLLAATMLNLVQKYAFN